MKIMNQAHYHLLFNHLPIIVPMVGFLVLIGGFITRSEVVKRTAYFIFTLGALFTFPAFATGEGAEDIAKGIKGIGRGVIHEHEESAETFALLSYGLGVVSIIALWSNWKRKSFSNALAVIVIICAAVVMFFAQQTGLSGGQIRHTEIRE